MNTIRARLWPSSLAARLAVSLFAALALAQIATIVVLHNREGAVVEELGHGQALNQTVAFVRLLTLYPADEADVLASAFTSRVSCAFVGRERPLQSGMSDSERQLTSMLKPMLHGLNVGAPAASIRGNWSPGTTCPNQEAFAPPERAQEIGDRQGERGNDNFSHWLGVSISVPIADGRWATLRTAIEPPSGWNQATLLSFLASSLAVAAVAIFSVRAQTGSLRALADASERFGRGEDVAPLKAAGPSEVVATARAFNTMQERLGRFLKDRLRLLASISHDLRTPLTTLRLKAEFVEDEATREGIVATIDEMIAITEATLAFSRAEATAEKTQTVDLAELSDEIGEEFRIGEHDVVTLASPPCLYPCRPVALKRALRNLVQNAVRYAGGARINVERRADAVVIIVDDDGPGMPPGRIEEAFEPFVRLEPSRSAETGGLGLGLAIARSIVNAHGGALTLANRQEGGLRAEIDLPTQAPE